MHNTKKVRKKTHTHAHRRRQKFCSAVCLRAAWWKKKPYGFKSLFFSLHSYCLCAKLHLIFTFLFKHSFISMICEISKLFFFHFAFLFLLNLTHFTTEWRRDANRAVTEHTTQHQLSPRLAHQRRAHTRPLFARKQMVYPASYLFY